MPNYVDVTETAGEQVAQEQIDRAVRRYAWAAKFCDGKDVLEVACGTGSGLGLLLKRARSVQAGDISEVMVDRVGRHYGQRIRVQQMDAQNLPFPESSFDVVIIFEALYYLPKPELFARECARILRPGGIVLVSNANKDLYDFNPSPYSNVYHGVLELKELFEGEGFEVRFWGDTPVQELSWRQKLLRPIKKAAVTFGLMPRTMQGKKLLKRLVFGRMASFPAEITEPMLKPFELSVLSSHVPDRLHKVILCVAHKA